MSRSDQGFSLVEVIIAMFLLAVIAMAILPLTIGAARASVGNRDLVAATTFANAQLAPIIGGFPNDPSAPTSCAALHSYSRSDVVDPGGTGLTADITVGTCPTSYPGTVTVTVVVSQGASTLVTLPTRVLVSLA